MAKLGGPVRSGGSSTELLGSGRLKADCALGITNLPVVPSPETLASGFGFPPLIEMPTELLPVPLPEFPVSPLPLPAPGTLLGEVPEAPGLPSGEIATRAARFP